MGLLLPLLSLPPVPAARPVATPGAIRFTARFKASMAGIAALEPARVPDLAALRMAAIAAARLATHAEGIAEATRQLDRLDARIAASRAAAAQAASAAAAAAPAERLYTLVLGTATLENATKAQACKTAAIQLKRLEGDLENGFETHCRVLKIASEEPFAAWISGGITKVMGGAKMPPLEIWDGARTAVVESRRALKREDVDAIVPLLAIIASSTQIGFASIGKANESAIDSAGKAVKGLTKVKELSTDALVKGAERLGGKPAGAAMAGVYASALDLAGQAAEVHLAKTKERIDLKAVQEAGMSAFILQVVGDLLHGALAPRFSKMFGAYLSEAAFSEKQLLRMGHAVGLTGAMPRDYLATTVQKLVSGFVTDKSVDLVKGLVEKLLKGGKKEVEEAGPEGLMPRIEAAIAKGALNKALAAFVDYMVEKAVIPK